MNNDATFNIKGVEYGLFFAEDGQIEIYEEKNPSKTGFIFPDEKKFMLFINSITDAMEKRISKEK